MAYNIVPTVANGDSWSAAQHNTYLKDNMAALWPYTSAGDMPYATASNTLGRVALGAVGAVMYSTGSAPAWLAKPSVDSILRQTGAAVAPSWLALNAIPGLLHAKALVDYDALSQVITGSTWVDVTNGTVNIVTTRTCTIVMYASGAFAGSNIGLVRAVIGGTAMTGGHPRTFASGYNPYGFAHYRASVPAGTITCKVQGQALTGPSDTATFGIGKIVVQAFTE